MTKKQHIEMINDMVDILISEAKSEEISSISFYLFCVLNYTLSRKGKSLNSIYEEKKNGKV